MAEKEYIERNALIAAYDAAHKGPPGGARKLMVDAPAADVVEVKHGEWVEHDDDWCGTYYTCSACGCDWTTIDGTPQENYMKYCPNCGAKMDGERKEQG